MSLRRPLVTGTVVLGTTLIGVSRVRTFPRPQNAITLIMHFTRTLVLSIVASFMFCTTTRLSEVSASALLPRSEDEDAGCVADKRDLTQRCPIRRRSA